MASSLFNHSSAIVDVGTETGITVPANSSISKVVTFNKTFPITPQVVACLFRGYGTAAVLANIQINVTAVTTTNATIMIYNANSDDLSVVGVRWIATV